MFFDTNSLDLFFKIIILGPLSLTFIILSIRIVGLRSFSKMTAFDFVTTVAIGSLLASAAKATTWSSFTQATGAIAALFIFQIILWCLWKWPETEGFVAGARFADPCFAGPSSTARRSRPASA